MIVAGSANPLLLGQSQGYNLTKSLRFRSSASAYLNRSVPSNGDRQKMTFSFWCKRGNLSSSNGIYCSGASGSGASQSGGNLTIGSSLEINQQTNNSYDWRIVTTQVFRDPSAWYHFVIAFDTTQATASNRLKIYVNGSQITAFSTASYPSQNLNTRFNNSGDTLWGAIIDGGSPYIPFDGYFTEVNFIDGQALTPSSFGSTNAATGVWQPIKYTGTYGTNGFYLPFTNTTSTSTLGNDFSGNGNNWTTNNISLTAGSTYDSMTDVPTLTSATASNFAVLNPLIGGGLVTFSEGNLKAVSTSPSAPYNIESTIKTPTTGKWYAEVTMLVGAGNPAVGIGNNIPDSFTAYRTNGTYITSGMGASSSGTPATFTNNDVIGIAYDADAGTLSFYKNGVAQSGGFTGITAGNYSFMVRKDSASGDGGYLNCGQRPFAYTPPSGFSALNTFNLPTPTIGATASTQANDYFDVTTYTGTGSSQSITNSGSMQPDFVWIKGRSGATDHGLYDAVRGVQKQLESNNTDAETTETTGLTAFNSNGFTVGALAQLNTSSATYVGWQWKANGSGSSNTAGSITSTVSANTTAGFSVVIYTGTGSAATVGHGLGITPSMVIVKRRDNGAGGTNWLVYHSQLNNGVNPAQYNLKLNLTNATAGLSTIWNDTAPTSTVFSVGTNAETNGSSGTFVAYCFAQIAGYSAFGSYTGNGSTDGPFIYLGFRPRLIIIKETTPNLRNWVIYDSSRSPYNQVGAQLLPNLSNAEDNGSGLYNQMDFLSNGVKFRSSTNSEPTNESGATYIYAAFAESPFKYANAR